MLKYTVLITALLATISAVTLTHADEIAAVDSQSCKSVMDIKKPFILALKKGEDISTAITKCASEAKLSGASFSGVGTLENPTLTYYHPGTQLYLDKPLKGIYELDAISGDITEEDGKLIPLIHVSLSDNEHHALGGRLLDGKIATNAEITITPMQGKLVKKMDKATGLESIVTHS
jgi:uncharacterized protein